MIDWLLDTLVWTGALIALVLLLRRPVARHLGAQAAYALWLIPFARLFLPAIELPANFAPEVAPVPALAIDPVLVMAVQAEPAEPATGWLWLALAIAVWLTGAAVTLAWRFGAYFRMRARLLDGAEEKLAIGPVRIVETPATESPLAFGVIDRVIAVPAGFLGESDRQTRNLAIAHELAHHERGDLLANMAVQPLFALHWFNPLGWLGWRAMRRDQEAACDARVVAMSDHETRAAYARTIARFSAGPDLAFPDLALAAPMACPVLGEKSIIHRLRSLQMADISVRRRIAGRTALVAGLLALPLTASFTYASPSFAQAAPEAPDSPDQREHLVIRDIDPDSAGRARADSAELAAITAELSAEAEAIAAEARELRVVFLKDGEAVSEEAMVGRARRLDERMAELRERGIDDVDIRMNLGEAHMVDVENLARLEALGHDMAQLGAEFESPEWKAHFRALENLSLRMLEDELPRMHELKRDALAAARRAIERDRNLTEEERRRALAGLRQAMDQE